MPSRLVVRRLSAVPVEVISMSVRATLGARLRPWPPPGAIAQLGERLDRTQEVGGSSPPSSILRKSVVCGVFTVGADPSAIQHLNWVAELGSRHRV